MYLTRKKFKKVGPEIWMQLIEMREEYNWHDRFLDKQAEGVGISLADRELELDLAMQLSKLVKEETIKWMQRAKGIDLRMGTIVPDNL
jgi:hypothetical protein